jgi:S1-C subfamily serine protease
MIINGRLLNSCVHPGINNISRLNNKGEMKMKNITRRPVQLWVIAITTIALAACQPLAGLSLPQIGQAAAQPTTQAQTGAVVPSLPQAAAQTDLTALYQQVNPGVVSIQTLTDQGGGLGSGFVYDKEGHIITNYHVVDGATSLEVDFPSGLKLEGKVVAKDPDSDLAVVKVDAPADQLVPLALGDSSQLKVGQPVIAIGNPFGLTSTMTTGIVSALGRTMESMRQAPGGSFFTAAGQIQTDAAINPGNSGGPLLDTMGEVIGINRAIQTNQTVVASEPGNIGIGFAIPINIVKRVVPFLIKDGKFDYPYLGLSSLDNLSLRILKALGVNNEIGAYVTSVVSGGPADKGGVKAGNETTAIQGLSKGGDWIVAIDGQPVKDFGSFLNYLIMNKQPGDTVTLTVNRNGEKVDLKVTLEKRP